MDWINKMKKIMIDQGVNIEKLKTRIEQNGNSLSRNSIGNILNERNSPKIETLQLIAMALEIELSELFSTSKTDTSDNIINGFIEYDGQIHRIKTKNDIKQLFESMEEDIETKPSSIDSETVLQKFNNIKVRSFIERGGANRKSIKLTRHVIKKYNITVCNKKEFLETPNDLKRDIKIWAFRSKDDEQKAKIELRKLLNFKFNE
ncbi:MAG: helix-turn-helix domain-containing protein [Draconibacterium sp.]|nr:helix-turn-helix domain-containing protein [Draconibacterium sp.]